MCYSSTPWSFATPLNSIRVTFVFMAWLWSQLLLSATDNFDGLQTHLLHKRICQWNAKNDFVMVRPFWPLTRHNNSPNEYLGGIQKLRWQAWRGGLVKCQRYYISLCSKLVNEGRGSNNSSKCCQHSLWMPPNSI